MEAPEKIYLLKSQDRILDGWYNKQPIPKTFEQVEYIRTDVFIEKALEFFENDLCCYIKAKDFTIDHGRLETDFKKAMKL